MLSIKKIRNLAFIIEFGSVYIEKIFKIFSVEFTLNSGGILSPFNFLVSKSESQIN